MKQSNKLITGVIMAAAICLIPSWGFVAHADPVGFSSLFGVEVYMDQNLQAGYEFVISPGGLLCPERRTGPGGAFQFFSNVQSNRGCLNVSQFATSTQVIAEFLSANNLGGTDSAGVAELPGKRFRVTATRIGSPEFTNDSPRQLEAVDLALTLTGKTYTYKAGFQIWAQGDYALNIRFEKNSDGTWRVLRLVPSSDDDSVMTNGDAFSRVQVYLTSPSEIGAGLGRLFGTTGTEKSPIQINASPDEIFYRP